MEKLDIVEVRVLKEEEEGEEREVVNEIKKIEGIEEKLNEEGMIGVEVVKRKGEMEVKVKKIVRIGEKIIESKIEIEIGILVEKIDESECIEVDKIGNIEEE